MGWSYSGDPSSGTRDQVRFLIRDTVQARPLVQDEEIDWLLTQEANVYMTAARAVEVGMLTATRGVQSRTAGDVSVTYMAPSESRALATMLRQRGQTYQRPSAGGISVADKKVLQQNEDWPPLPVSLGSMDNRFAGGANPLLDPTAPVIGGG